MLWRGYYLVSIKNAHVHLRRTRKGRGKGNKKRGGKGEGTIEIGKRSMDFMAGSLSGVLLQHSCTLRCEGLS